MKLQEHLVKLSSYNIGCKFIDGFFLINISFDKEWSIIPPDNENIEYTQKEKVHYYCAPIDYIDDVFKLIDDTIEYNLDLQRKLELFKEKVEELRTIFANETIDKLKTIEFTFKTDIRKRSKKNNKKKSEIIEEKETPKEEILSEPDDSTTDIVDNNSYDDIVYNDYQGED